MLNLTSGTYDNSIGARYLSQLGIDLPPNETFNSLVPTRLSDAQLRGLSTIRKADQGRKGKAKAGHYTTICK